MKPGIGSSFDPLTSSRETQTRTWAAGVLWGWLPNARQQSGPHRSCLFRNHLSSPMGAETCPERHQSPWPTWVGSCLGMWYSGAFRRLQLQTEQTGHIYICASLHLPQLLGGRQANWMESLGLGPAAQPGSRFAHSWYQHAGLMWSPACAITKTEKIRFVLTWVRRSTLLRLMPKQTGDAS